MKYKKIITLVMVLILISSGMSVLSNAVKVNEEEVNENESLSTLFAGGSGTEDDPYEISDVDQLQNMNEYLDAHYELVNDIDASETKDWNNGSGFMPVGKDSDNKFTGSLDGQGYEISNLYINRENYLGLFGCTGSSANINNICLINVTVNGEYSQVGGIIGLNKGKLKNSYAIANLSGISNVGGLVGSNQGTICNSYYNFNDVLINGKHRITIGALYEEQYQDWISSGKTLEISDYSDTLVPSGEYYEISSVEGLKHLLGFTDDKEYKFRLGSDIDLSGESGLYVPYLSADFDGNGYTIRNLHLNRSGGSQFGLFGYLSKDASVKNVGIENVKVDGGWYVGGLVGYNEGTVSNSYATGYVARGTCVGGLIGINSEGTVSNSYASVTVSGYYGVGGLVGINYEGTVRNSYARGVVSGDEDVGGLVGGNQGTISNSFWDVDTTEQSSSAGGTGKTTVEMKDISTFTDTSTEGLSEPWDFVNDSNDDDGDKDIWNIDDNKNDGYPFLAWQEYDDGGTGSSESSGGEDTPGFTLMILLFSLSLVAIYRYRKKKR